MREFPQSLRYPWDARRLTSSFFQHHYKWEERRELLSYELSIDL